MRHERKALGSDGVLFVRHEALNGLRELGQETSLLQAEQKKIPGWQASDERRRSRCRRLAK